MDLYTACTLNHPKAIEMLTQSNNLNMTNKKGWTCLMYACYYGNKNLVDRIVDLDPTTLFSVNSDKQTPLMIATMSGNVSIVKRTFHGLHRNTSVEHCSVMNTYGIIFSKNLTYFSVFEVDDIYKHWFTERQIYPVTFLPSIIERTLQTDVIASLSIALNSKDSKLMNVPIDSVACYLCSTRATVDILETPDKLGRTAMFYAVLYNQEEILEYFIEKQANCNVIDNFGKTMTMTAISKGFRRIMTMLYEYGNKHEKNVLKTTSWSEKIEKTKNNHQNDERIDDYHMEKLLKQLSLEKYWPVFDERKIRYNDFLKLSEQDLKDIGINLFGPRRKLIMTIDKLNELRTSQEHSRS